MVDDHISGIAEVCDCGMANGIALSLACVDYSSRKTGTHSNTVADNSRGRGREVTIRAMTHQEL